MTYGVVSGFSAGMAPLELPETRQGWVSFLSARCDGRLSEGRNTVEVTPSQPDAPAKQGSQAPDARTRRHLARGRFGHAV